MSKPLSEELGELLDDCNVQVTMTGWKAELIKTEKELKLIKDKADDLAEALDGCIKMIEKDGLSPSWAKKILNSYFKETRVNKYTWEELAESQEFEHGQEFVKAEVADKLAEALGRALDKLSYVYPQYTTLFDDMRLVSNYQERSEADE